MRGEGRLAESVPPENSIRIINLDRIFGNDNMTQQKNSWLRPIGVYLAAAAAFMLLEALVFRTGFYAQFLEPISSAGIFEGSLRDELGRRQLGPDEVLVIGDSRIGEGFSAPIANDSRGERGYYFANGSVPGTTPRSWYYELRDLDPTRRRYHAIVLPVESYEDVDTQENYSNRTLDLHYVVARLRYSDILEFTFSFQTARDRFEVFRGSLLKGFIYQPDLLALIENREKRMKDVAQWREHGSEWRNGYGGRQEDLRGLEVNWASGTIRMPENLPPDRRASLQATILTPPAPHTGQFEMYQRKWFGKIINLYRGSETRLVFLALPRGPAPRPDPPVVHLSHSIRDFSSSGQAILLPERAFQSLERPECYFDALHLNSRGRRLFSVMLAQIILEKLGPSHN